MNKPLNLSDVAQMSNAPTLGWPHANLGEYLHSSKQGGTPTVANNIYTSSKTDANPAKHGRSGAYPINDKHEAESAEYLKGKAPNATVKANIDRDAAKYGVGPDAHKAKMTAHGRAAKNTPLRKLMGY